MSEYKISYDYTHVPTVKAFAESDLRIKAIMGPFGSGKSSGCIMEILRRALAQKPGPDGIRRTRWAIVRNTYPQLNDTTIKTVLEWLPPAVFGKYRGQPHHDYKITLFKDCEIELLFRALDKPEHVSNLLSLELTGGWINEAREVPKAILDALDGRIDRYPPLKNGGATWTGIIMDTNPPDEDSWWYHMFEEPEHPFHRDDAQIWKQPSGLSQEAENLLSWDEFDAWNSGQEMGNLPGLKPDYYSNLAKGKTIDYINVYIHGRYGFVKEGKPVYEASYNDNAHISPISLRPILGREILVAMDFGLTPAAAILQITPRGFLNVLEELVTEDMGIEQFIQNMLNPTLSLRYTDNPVLVTGDPAGNQRAQTDKRTCYDLLRMYGFKVKACDSNDLAARISSLEYFLCRMTDGKPTLRIDPSCKMIRKGFNKGYYYKQITGKDERTLPEPVKNIYSHIMNALEYGAMHIMHGIRRVERPKRVHRQYQPASIAGY